MIEIRQKIENCSVLKINYDLHHDRLINSFMHRHFLGESTQPIPQCSYNNRS